MKHKIVFAVGFASIAIGVCWCCVIFALAGVMNLMLLTTLVSFCIAWVWVIWIFRRLPAHRMRQNLAPLNRQLNQTRETSNLVHENEALRRELKNQTDAYYGRHCGLCGTTCQHRQARFCPRCGETLPDFKSLKPVRRCDVCHHQFETDDGDQRMCPVCRLHSGQPVPRKELVDFRSMQAVAMPLGSMCGPDRWDKMCLHCHKMFRTDDSAHQYCPMCRSMGHDLAYDKRATDDVLDPSTARWR